MNTKTYTAGGACASAITTGAAAARSAWTHIGVRCCFEEVFV